jgi:hypothetical protein
MLRRRLPLALFVAAACTCDTDASKDQYTCMTLRDCVVGFSCVAGVCVPDNGDAGAGTGGGSALGGGTAMGGGSAVGGGSSMGGGIATGGGASMGGGSAAGGGGVQGASIVIKTGPQSVIQGGCSNPVTIQVQNAQGQPFIVSAAVTVTLTASPPTAISFSPSGCSSAVTSVVVPAGQSSATFQFKAAVNGMVTIFISANGLNGDSQMETLLPIVRRGTCALLPMASTVDCPISPPQSDLTHTALFFQAVGADVTPSQTEVRCQLIDTTKVTCDRAGTGTTTSIAWQTLEPAGGALNVQHVPWSCNQVGTLAQPITPVNTAESFVLRSYRQIGSFFNDNDFLTAQLTDAMTVTLQTGGGDICGDATGGGPMLGALQVVQVAGASVTRGSTGAVPGNTYTIVGVPNVSTTSTMLLSSFRGVDPAMLICDRTVRASLNGPAAIDFSRGMSIVDGGCTGATLEDIEWERVDFGVLANVHPFLVFMDAGVTTATVAQPPGTDPTRAIVIMTAQGAAGVGAGESEDVTDDPADEANATCTLGAAGATVTRGTASAPALFSGQLIQWKP